MRTFFHVGGRLGNQLFQWAYSHQIHQRYNCKVYPFLDSFHHKGSSFTNEQSGFIQSADIESVSKRDTLGLLLKILDRMSDSKATEFICRILGIHRSLDSFELPPLPQRRPRLVTGFFINVEVLKDSEEEIFSDLSNRLRIVKGINTLPESYQAIHVRRGDFTSAENNYGLIDLKFYAQNIVENLPIVLCTESASECQEIIEALAPEHILDSKNSTPWQAIKVLSDAQHLILSNSTLSWWAGFVAAKRGAKVIIPSPFYLNFESKQELIQFHLFSPATAFFKPTF